MLTESVTAAGKVNLICLGRHQKDFDGRSMKLNMTASLYSTPRLYNRKTVRSGSTAVCIDLLLLYVRHLSHIAPESLLCKLRTRKIQLARLRILWTAD
jgi:hypothetical protein